MSRPALAASLFALVLVAGVLAPRLRPTPACTEPQPPTVAGIAPIPEISMRMVFDAPIVPGSIIPEATEPPIPVAPIAPPQVVLPEAPINDWDGCPACGMG